ncbi:MAG TPA: bifunctional 5,10-methylenetetrahydrofolate dehydrogenase/5,10-methenyltetrahydrofolate cyclohydrolase [Bacillota bacterium]|nr:bifunctional 5,10-methylenetetrahydrofolate dehydrogenase/5,10-methenyltetrahydrofolate cyclohydrolase [Bacillota bacterium]HPX69483.1 bifunctional 5,10-methylenetetrahydrofolate dehydrogenase/5,10-methenyltetrahydrofolate cyclohydrolase [Bacillota bacterium]HQA66244.1 bifunctional 5,10-methylenetetrahydrofolate dehydrogenase/5,10-methenyltetrahydrofolate cyclohydrolase [Bacillota bacterium]HQO43121.1 bifunctional 5,10-methylenetetrahydrofolate dehydrogenase/5,10-methenyltetrahydrofolate cycl
MAVLDCREAARSIKEELAKKVQLLAAEGLKPKLGIIRVGARPEDISYEKGIIKNCESIGISCEVTALSDDISNEDFMKALEAANSDRSINGILVFRPLPAHIDEDRARNMINPAKDIDCMNPYNLAKVFEGDDSGFEPCTPAAVMEIIRFFGINLQGENVAVIGRSMVVGKPLSMMLLKENATVTICHSRTKDISSIVSRADIVVAALGKARAVGADYIKPGAVVIDVGVNGAPEGGICGDVDFEKVKDIASKITPVPGGVGAVTTLMLLKHVVEAAQQGSAL